MNIVKKTAAVLLISAGFSGFAQAGAMDGLSACKSKVAEDASLSSFEHVSVRMDRMQSKGRYSLFTLGVNATNADGEASQYKATCKARRNGRVEEMGIAWVSGDNPAQVAAAN